MARESADDPPDQSDEEYWISAVNQCSIAHYAEGSLWAYSFGSLIASSYCISDIHWIVDQEYIRPIAIPRALPIPGEFIWNENGENAGMETPPRRIGQEILDKFDPSRLPPIIALQSPQARSAIEKSPRTCSLQMINTTRSDGDCDARSPVHPTTPGALYYYCDANVNRSTQWKVACAR